MPVINAVLPEKPGATQEQTKHQMFIDELKLPWQALPYPLLASLEPFFPAMPNMRTANPWSYPSGFFQ